MPAHGPLYPKLPRVRSNPLPRLAGSAVAGPTNPRKRPRDTLEGNPTASRYNFSSDMLKTNPRQNFSLGVTENESYGEFCRLRMFFRTPCRRNLSHLGLQVLIAERINISKN